LLSAGEFLVDQALLILRDLLPFLLGFGVSLVGKSFLSFRFPPLLVHGALALIEFSLSLLGLLALLRCRCFLPVQGLLIRARLLPFLGNLLLLLLGLLLLLLGLLPFLRYSLLFPHGGFSLFCRQPACVLRFPLPEVNHVSALIN
jgi:hypothetical protein